MEKVGLGEGDVQFVSVPVQNVSSALEKGQIFAGHIYDPFLDDAIKKGFKILSTSADVPGIITGGLAFHSDLVNQKPQDIQNIIKSMDEAKKDYDKNKEQDINIMSQKTGFSIDKIREGLDKDKLLDLSYNIKNSFNKNLNDTTSLYKLGNDIEKFYAERGVISNYINIEDLLDPDFINALIKVSS